VTQREPQRGRVGSGDGATDPWHHPGGRDAIGVRVRLGLELTLAALEQTSGKGARSLRALQPVAQALSIS
jgi:hypothetical protein